MFYYGWDPEKRQILCIKINEKIKGEKYKNLYNFLTCLV